MIDSSYTLKIADFGYAGPIQGRDGKGLLFSLLGTPNYMGPEILKQMPYVGESVDLFASAVILFTMVS